MTGLFWLLLGLTGLTLALHAIARLLYVPVGARMFGQIPWLPSQWREPLAEGEPVRLTAAGGTRLEGTYLPTTAVQRHGVIACCHEFNGDRWNSLPYAESLRGRGFDLLLFDFRNHGGSDRTPGYEPTPWVTSYETADVRAVVDYLVSRPDALPQGVGLFGLSKGGTAALAAAADDPRVQAVVVEGVCPTERMQAYCCQTFLADHCRFAECLLRLPELLLRPLGAWVRLVVGWRRHCRFVNVEQAARRVAQPVLLIHGDADPHVPVEVVRSLQEAMGPRTSLWVVPRAKHTGASTAAGDEYHERIAWFFTEHLAPKVSLKAAETAAVRRVDAAVDPRPAKPLEHIAAF